MFSAHSHEIEAIYEQRNQELVTCEDGSAALPVPQPPRQPTAEELASQRRGKRLATSKQVWDLRQQG